MGTSIFVFAVSFFLTGWKLFASLPDKNLQVNLCPCRLVKPPCEQKANQGTVLKTHLVITLFPNFTSFFSHYEAFRYLPLGFAAEIH